IPKDIFTVADRTVLNHPLRDETMTRASVMDHAPKMTLEELIHGVGTLRITDPDTPASQAMPINQKVLIIVYTSDLRGVTNEATLKFKDAELATRFLKDIKFTE